jgi:zinc-ribbon domain
MSTMSSAPVTTAEHCTSCGAPIAQDQRYCLNCGRRLANVRPPWTREPQPAAAQPQPRAAFAIAGRPVPPLALGGGLAIFVVALLIGIATGNSGDGGKTVAAGPRVITVSVPAAGAAAAVPASFTSDWPDGQNGFTVQLQTLPKDGTQPAQVAQAKSAAQSKGAEQVGALDSDDFSSLDGGNYVIYTGVYDTRKQAQKSLKKMKGDFAGAKVIKVSSGGGLAPKGDAGALSGKKKSATVGKQQLQQLKNTSPGDYQKKSSKLPDETKLPGKAPKKDTKKPGGGSGGGITIGQ